MILYSFIPRENGHVSPLGVCSRNGVIASSTALVSTRNGTQKVTYPGLSTFSRPTPPRRVRECDVVLLTLTVMLTMNGMTLGLFPLISETYPGDCTLFKLTIRIS